jgi:hypothetical protein
MVCKIYGRGSGSHIYHVPIMLIASIMLINMIEAFLSLPEITNKNDSEYFYEIGSPVQYGVANCTKI